jgi:hypothetical protein
MSVISDVRNRIERKFEQQKQIKEAERNAQDDITSEYIRGKIDERKRLAYEKGKASANKKSLGIFSNIVKPFTPEEIKAMNGANPMNQPQNNYQSLTPVNPNFQNNSSSPSQFIQPVFMTKEMEVIEALRRMK